MAAITYRGRARSIMPGIRSWLQDKAPLKAAYMRMTDFTADKPDTAAQDVPRPEHPASAVVADSLQLAEACKVCFTACAAADRGQPADRLHSAQALAEEVHRDLTEACYAVGPVALHCAHASGRVPTTAVQGRGKDLVATFAAQLKRIPEFVGASAGCAAAARRVPVPECG